MSNFSFLKLLHCADKTFVPRASVGCARRAARANTMAVRMAEREVGLVDERLVHETHAILIGSCLEGTVCCSDPVSLYQILLSLLLIKV